MLIGFYVFTLQILNLVFPKIHPLAHVYGLKQYWSQIRVIPGYTTEFKQGILGELLNVKWGTVMPHLNHQNYCLA